MKTTTTINPWLWEQLWSFTGVRLLTRVLVGVFTLAAVANFKIPLPFTPVPISLMNLAVPLLGAFYGVRLGVATTLLYIAAGTCGLPFFSGGAAGIAHLLGPTGGYIIGFIGQAWLAGKWLHPLPPLRPLPYSLAFMASHLPVYVCGLLWLMQFVPNNSIWMLGFLPFLPGDGLKMILGYCLLKRFGGYARRNY